MQKVKELFKNKKLVMIVGVITALIVISIITLIFLQAEEKETTIDTPDKTTTPVVDESKKDKQLKYTKNLDCVSYIEKAEATNYDTLLESEYSSTLYKYDSDENNEYYLVCLTDIKYNGQELTESIENKDLTIEELDNILKEQEVDSLKVVRDIKESEEEEETFKDDEEDEKETSSSTDKNTSSSNSTNNKNNSSSSNNNKNNSNNSSSSGNSSNSKPSGGSTTSSKEKDNATLRKQLAASGLSWDFNTKAEAEAFMKKWVNRGFTAGYYVNNYGDSDTAYSGYVQLLAVNYSCLKSNLNVDWHHENNNMKDPVRYLHSLGYDVSGLCAIYDGSYECF